MQHSDEMRRALEECDMDTLRRLWAHVSPNMPQPKTEEEARVIMHMARTQTGTILFKARAYSHAWLTERGLPSQLPDDLKPSAERLYPRVATGVGISVNMRDPDMKPVAQAVEKAMSNAVEDAYAHGNEDPVFVKARMMEARALERRRLFGMAGLFALGGFRPAT